MFYNYQKYLILKAFERGYYMTRKGKFKKYASLLMASSLTLGVLAACGDSSGSGDGEEIVIGGNLELTGGVASYGTSINDGAKLAIKEINEKGGINGKKIRYEVIDNRSENAEAVSAMTKLITEKKAVAVVAPATSGNTTAIVELANKNKVPIVTGSGTAETVTVAANGTVNDYAFRTCFIDPFQGIVAANFASKELNAKNVAIYSDSSSDYAKGLAEAFKSQIEKNGGKVVIHENYVAKDVDFKGTLTRIKGANPDFIFVPGYYEEVGLIVKQARELGIDAPLMGGDGWDSPKLLELAGKDALNNTFITNHYSSGDPDPKIQDFVKAFEDEYGSAPNAFHALGYDTVYFIADAIKRAGDNVTGEAIQKALAETKDLNLVTGTFTVDEKHNPVKSASVLEYVNGEQTFKSKVNP